MDLGLFLLFLFSVSIILIFVIIIWHKAVESAKPPKTSYDDIQEAVILDGRGHPIKQKIQNERLLPSKTIRNAVNALFLIIGILLVILISTALIS